jgi:hypothetical protein
MALDFNRENTPAENESPTVDSTELSSDDLLAPTCIFWGMIIGLALFGGSVVIWIIENIGKIGQ